MLSQDGPEEAVCHICSGPKFRGQVRPTWTHALLPGSVAIDQIPAYACEVDEDQRGEPRPGGTMCDVGAFEVQP
jgi:hypothetical protein